MQQISGTIVDIVARRTYKGTLHIEGGRIHSIVEEDVQSSDVIVPGFVDAHIHIESSMLPPNEFARLAVVHGTVATVSDPHEIANVLGVAGVQYMVQLAEKVPLKIMFGAPSCVPATTFESAGARITPNDIAMLFKDSRIGYLSEMMNFPGVLHNNPEVLAKLDIAKANNRPVDGHAPGLRGELAKAYIEHGISTDHECFTLEEALEKLSYGMKIIIREGSAAKNFEALHSLISTHTNMVMLCSDDKHPDSLAVGHINSVAKRALDKGHSLFDVLQVACLNAVQHYKLPVGLLQQGDAADFAIVDSLDTLNVLATYINGECVARFGKSLLPYQQAPRVNNFVQYTLSESQFSVPALGSTLRVMEVLDGELITNVLEFPLHAENGYVRSDITRDILKISVVNRYSIQEPALAFIKNFGLQRGAIASSVAHDSHNIICVGVDDASMAKAVNALMQSRGGVCVVDGNDIDVLPLDIAGLMSSRDGYLVAEHYAALDAKARAMGSQLTSPFMSLSFMALLVIPSLKLSDKGLFDGTTFSFTSPQL